MTPRPKVSIIMPVYNGEKSLPASIDSIRAQSYKSWELIIIDDGSTDSSYTLAKAYNTRDSRIRCYYRQNSGPSRARNYAISISRGEYVAFLDADDQWSPHRLLDLIYKFQTTPKAGVLFTRTRFVDAKTGILGALTPHISRLDAATLLAENPTCSTSNIMCKQDVLQRIGGFKADLDYAEDQDWLLRVALDGAYEICGVNTEGLYYTSAPGSQSSDLEAMYKGWRRLITDAAKNHPEIVGQLRPGATAKFYRYLARRALRMRAPNTALKYLCASLRHDPSLILKQPKRTGLTWLGALLSSSKITRLEELPAR